MRIHKKLIAAAIAAIVLPISAFPQDAGRLIGEDITRCAGQLHSYEAPEIRDTPPPRGYKAFYVSHFGRHGSRYHTSDKFTPTREAFARMDSLGLLSDTGRMVRHIVDTMAIVHEGMYGYLTRKGALEHSGIAERLCRRVPSVFRSKDRREVYSVSSTVVRCNQSSAAFCTELKGFSPALDIHFITNERTDDAVTRVSHGGRNPALPQQDRGLELVDSVKRSRLPELRFGARMFTDPEAAKVCIGEDNWHLFMYNLLSHGVIEQCLDEDMPKIYSYFTEDELVAYCASRTAACINAHGLTLENGEVLRRVGALMIADLVEKADAALAEGSHRAADLRFSHDGGLLPLMQQLGLEGFPPTCHVGQEWEKGWYSFEQIPMATNIQFIFYRNRGGTVLVKVLHNEKETRIRGLETVSGPYYDWTDLRSHLCVLSSMYY